ncbi:MAG: tRNA epoxyqueuosine(34) reductase QueG [Acidimicrobiales bacterium]
MAGADGRPSGGDPTPTPSELKEVGRRAGLDAVGIAAAEIFTSTRRDLEERKAAGLHGGMAFTYRRPERSTDPGLAVSGARSIVVGAIAYRGGSDGPPPAGPPAGRVAAYAREDRYGALRGALKVIASTLLAAGHRARVLVDDNGLVDREAARRAGLGWYGKSSNLLLPGRGSWFVLGSVITTAPLEADGEPVPDGCGSCRRCLDACPTGAIVAPGVVDAGRCLSWLLQQRGSFPIAHRAALGDRIYGCDDCQEVCPPNKRVEIRGGSPAAVDATWVHLLDMLSADDATLLERHGRWYIADRDPRWLRRNALVVLGNVAAPGDIATAAAIARYRDGDDPVLAEHAAWAADQIEARGAEANSPA